MSCVPLEQSWNDLGDWNSVTQTMELDNDGNKTSDGTTAIDCKNILLWSDTERIHLAAFGIDNILAVVNDDAVLVANKDRVQEVKSVVEELKKKNILQATKHLKNHCPWGWFESLSTTSNYQVKRLCIKPRAQLSITKSPV